ncbi:TetR/AcrR family transcriptional regulator [Clostridium coskatii]|uniref:Fatty acid metabolism regulator protein n=1 Tax=Clostridium coskatii TaxID=1705578 RepID=A0A168QA23_9CLOT|nr:TetR/AcrR family transcriptional regulator [Clostridium coskatii]OAA88828.1 Fatty acid metabolism regulator protein [Clostridium coskatii]OBR93591.1 fatty acid metabolism regulator protein [Clostridium coskatii]
MVQYKKDDVKERINNAALKVFSEKGYEKATISDISREANVSVGNIYKYYKSKEDIFYSVVPESFVEELKKLIKTKIIMWKEEDKKVENNLLMNKNLTNLMMNNRRIMTALFNGSKNTKYENLKDEIIELLSNLVINNYTFEGMQSVNEESRKLFLRCIFENLINMMSNIVLNVKKEEDLSALLRDINKYHTFGITGIIKNQK